MNPQTLVKRKIIGYIALIFICTLSTASAAITNITEPTECNSNVCLNLEVTCSGIIPATAEVEVLDHNVPEHKGTIVFLAGSAGTNFWNNSIPSRDAVHQLTNDGYTTVQLRWQEPGWFESSKGLKAAACRPRQVIRWVYNHIHNQSDAPFCGTGNSAGGTALAHSLIRAGSEHLFTAIVFTAGPPTARLDLGCNQNYNSGLSIKRNNAITLIDSAFQGQPCANAAPDDLALLYLNSANTIHKYGASQQVTMHFIFGEKDFSSAVDQGKIYAGQFKNVQIEEVPGVSHLVHKNEIGAQLIVDRLKQICQ